MIHIHTNSDTPYHEFSKFILFFVFSFVSLSIGSSRDLYSFNMIISSILNQPLSVFKNDFLKKKKKVRCLTNQNVTLISTYFVEYVYPIILCICNSVTNKIEFMYAQRMELVEEEGCIRILFRIINFIFLFFQFNIFFRFFTYYTTGLSCNNNRRLCSKYSQVIYVFIVNLFFK